MRDVTFSVTKYTGRGCVAAIAMGVIVLLAQPVLAQETRHETFPSAEAASSALYSAVEKQDERTLITILGAEKDLVSGGDETVDKLERERFVQKYREMHRLAVVSDRRAVLVIGAENWPFPIPLVEENGVWRFDADAGRKELLWRRIGQNEVTAIEASHALIAAARHEGAKPPADEAEIPVAELLAAAKSGESSHPFYGYYFRVLASQRASASVAGGRSAGSSAFIAYPAAYQSSGVMTFIVGKDDVVYEKDLGPETAKLARAMTDDNLDATWSVAAP
jgi:hypothetical protein